MSSDLFAAVLDRARAGDEDAFVELFRAVQPSVLRYLRALAPHDWVEDLASEAWVSVIKGLDRFRDHDETAFRAWVMTMARRRWIDEVRRRERRPETLTSTDSLSHLSAVGSVEDEVEERRSYAAAVALVRRLPAEQGEVVLLRVVAGLDVDQVAGVVGKSPGAVRVLSHRGLRKLEAMLRADVTNQDASSVEGLT